MQKKDLGKPVECQATLTHCAGSVHRSERRKQGSYAKHTQNEHREKENKTKTSGHVETRTSFEKMQNSNF